MHHYYVVYSMQTDKGTAIGRTQLTCDDPMDSFKRVEEIEQQILEHLRGGKEPSTRSLFLTWWQAINPDPQ